MKILTSMVLAIFLGLVASAQAGNNDKYVQYSEEQQTVSRLIAAKKGKLGADASKYEREMEATRVKLYSGITKVDRGTYYAQVEEGMKMLRRIRQTVEAK